MTSQPVLHFSLSSIFLCSCSPLPSGTWRTSGLSIPCCCLPTSSSVCLVFFPLSLCLARWFWHDLIETYDLCYSTIDTQKITPKYRLTCMSTCDSTLETFFKIHHRNKQWLKFSSIKHFWSITPSHTKAVCLWLRVGVSQSAGSCLFFFSSVE